MLHVYQKPLKGDYGIVFGSFAPLHRGHLDMIMRAKKENPSGVLLIVCGEDNDKGCPLMPVEKRYRYVREFFQNDDLVAVYGINDSELGLTGYTESGWTIWMEELNRLIEKAIVPNADGSSPKRRWYVGDKLYYDDLVKLGEQATLVDRTDITPISATMIRNNPLKYWNYIAPTFRRVFSHNILITGTASEGKSTMVTDLGKYFDTAYSYEWPRDFMEEKCLADWEIDAADFTAFLEGQFNCNRKAIDSPLNKGFFFADTDSLITNMYAQFYAQDESCAFTQKEYDTIVKPLAYHYAQKSRWNKIFMIVPHGVFVDDHSRFMKHANMESRQALINIMKESLVDVGDWNKVVILNGNYYENFMTIVRYVKEIHREAGMDNA